MREAASLASPYRQHQLPVSPMQHLAMTKHLALLAKAQAEGKAPGASAARHRPPPRAQVIVLAWFSLGVLTSGAAGVGALMGLRALEAGGTGVTWETLGNRLGTAWAVAWAKAPAIGAAPKPAESPDVRWDRVQVAIERNARANAPLGLRVTGADDLPIDIVMDGVPAGVRLSRGAPVGPSTWVLSRADLEGLHLALDESAPDAFDLRIGVMAPAGIAAAGSIVQVRVVEGGARTHAAADHRYQGGADAPAMPVGNVDRTELAYRGPAAGATAAAPGKDRLGGPRTQPPAETATKSWPEGASALGAVSREPVRPSWWKASPPAWSPFQDGSQKP